MKPYSLPAILLLFSCFFTPAHAQFRLDVEGGMITGTSYNKVRIPGNGGTMINLPKDLQENSRAFYRIKAGYTVSERHHFLLLYAPLALNYHGSLKRSINFNNQTFFADSPLNIHYKLNSFRLTYRYNFIQQGRWQVGAGLTAQIKNTDIRFKSELHNTNFKDIGFLPAINFYACYRPNYHWSFIAEGDALTSKHERYEDVFAGTSYQINSSLAIKLGYRMQEGSSDRAKMYNSSWVHYASAGILLSL